MHFAGSQGDLERVVIETVEIETPFCGNFVRKRRGKIVAPIRTAGRYKEFGRLPDG